MPWNWQMAEILIQDGLFMGFYNNFSVQISFQWIEKVRITRDRRPWNTNGNTVTENAN